MKIGRLERRIRAHMHDALFHENVDEATGVWLVTKSLYDLGVLSPSAFAP